MAELKRNVLISLNGYDIGESWGKLESAHHFYGEAWNTMFYWSETTGGGRFTHKAQQLFIIQLKKWMAGTGSSSLTLNHPSYNKEYQEFKEKYAKINRPWMLGGNVYDNVRVIWRDRHTQTVGIRPKVKVKKISMFGGDSGKMISVARYAAINEFGHGKHQPRPLFMPAMLKFVAEKAPKMKKAMEISIFKAAKKYANAIYESATTKGSPDVISDASIRAMNKVANANPNATFKMPGMSPNQLSKKVPSASVQSGQKKYGGMSWIKYSEQLFDAYMGLSGKSSKELEEEGRDL